MTPPTATAPHESKAKTAYTQLLRELRETAVLGSVSNLVAWDQETYMPAGADDARAEQRSLLASMIHKRLIDPRVGEMLEICESDGVITSDPDASANIREIRRDYDRLTKLPPELVAELTEVGSKAQAVWRDAREASDFKKFQPILERLVTLVRRKAECFGVPEGGELYDALLDEYEPDARAAEIESIFTPLGERLSALIADLKQNGKAPDTSCIKAQIPDANQHAFGLFVLSAIGFDLNCGRLDTTTHPFCEGVAPGDTRLTTRYREERFTDALYGTMHEAGHGIYDQGLKHDRFGQPLGEAVSLGIHESQSRMWENFVGRSRAFWEWALPHAKKHLGSSFGSPTTNDLYRAVNTAEPSFIRVEADEATYNLHIMLRFEIERALIKGDLAVKDIPGAWNEAVKRYLHLDVPDDKRGCLQDIHWSFGAIGYFPTYCLGNLYCAQFWEAALKVMPDLEHDIAKGEFAPLKTWLNENIHAPGRKYPAGELCQRVTGAPLSADPLMRHLESKLKPVYGLA